MWGWKKREKKRRGGKLASFFGAVYEFFNPVPVPVIPVVDSGFTDVSVTPVGVTNFLDSLVFTLFLVLVRLLILYCVYLLKLRPMTSIGRPEASNTRAPS